jgi:hypothetical protein
VELAGPAKRIVKVFGEGRSSGTKQVARDAAQAAKAKILARERLNHGFHRG